MPLHSMIRFVPSIEPHHEVRFVPSPPSLHVVGDGPSQLEVANPPLHAGVLVEQPGDDQFGVVGVARRVGEFAAPRLVDVLEGGFEIDPAGVQQADGSGQAGETLCRDAAEVAGVEDTAADIFEDLGGGKRRIVGMAADFGMGRPVSYRLVGRAEQRDPACTGCNTRRFFGF